MLPPYPEYKDSGAEWLGEVPNHWRCARLKYVADLINIKTERSASQLFVGLENIESGSARMISNTKDEEEAGALANRFEIENVLFGKLRPYLAKCWLATSSGLCSSEFFVLQGIKVKPQYLLHLMLNRGFVAEVNSSTFGAKMPRANWEFVGNLIQPVPPAAEQRVIAAFLYRETAKIDALIEKMRRLIELLQEKRQALISHSVTKGLNSGAPMKDSGVEWLGEVPGHWELKKAKYLIRSLKSGVSVNAIDTPKSKDELGVLKTSCVYTRSFRPEENKVVVDSDEQSRLSCPLVENTIIISRMNTPELVGAAAYVVQDEPTLFLPDRLWMAVMWASYCGYAEYLSEYFSTSGYRSLIAVIATGTSDSMKNIAQDDLLNVKVPVPPPRELDALMSEVRTFTESTARAVSAIQRAIDCLQEHRAALISAAVTGKIDVRGLVAEDAA